VPGILTQKLDNTWKLTKGTIMICLDGNGAPEKLGGQRDATFYKVIMLHAVQRLFHAKGIPRRCL